MIVAIPINRAFLFGVSFSSPLPNEKISRGVAIGCIA